MITDLIKGLVELVKALLVPFITWQAAQGAEAKRNAETLATQNEIASRPDVPDDELDGWLRQRR
ncbi:hypothetical protein [Inquilinus limosus]|uniref:Uncharacterized protein n=1 Tax=Inquilinus limosus MP06 TaxID=1398085 RepID=A0A0A0DFF7_9PROT|nr:hypothetical protein [Inquilinus limosus]KGM35722.1 hypothetical protein P409_02775 [Inquilinus limosus MP06]